MDLSANNQNNNSESSDINRESESPARTIDSHDSTSGSMDTIVDRAISQQHNQQQTIEQSMNTTNMQQQIHNSLTNSEIAILQQQNTSASDDEHQHLANSTISAQKQNGMQPQRPMDAQSHIYSSPVYDEKPMSPLKLTAATLVDSIKMPNGKDDLKKPKLISHNEFKQQLQNTLASRAATLESRISKKQRFPPELIKDDGSSIKSSKSLKKKSSSSSSAAKTSTDCCSAFPVQIVLGLLQLILSICLVALGSLLIVREAALSTAGCGIWTGLIAAVTGALGVVGLRKTQTSFLALSLVCIATSTLGIAISGVGLSRDVNRSEEKFDLLNSNGEISAASGLIFTLILHFVVSVISVYRCAMQICSRSKSTELHDIIVKSNANGLTALDPEKVEHYVKAISIAGSEKDNNEKLAALWMYAQQNGNMLKQKPNMPPRSRSVMLIPATGNLPPPPIPSRTMMSPQHLMPGQSPAAAMAAYRGMTLPYPLPRTASVPMLYGPPPGSMPGTFRTHTSTKSIDQRRKRRPIAGQMIRGGGGKSNANRRQRSKSNADVVDAGNPSFQYHGLDRAIADNFLARQEQTNTSSHMDYSSSTSASDAAGRKAPSRASSRTKIVCRDVVM